MYCSLFLCRLLEDARIFIRHAYNFIDLFEIHKDHKKVKIKESIQSILIDSRFLKLYKDNKGKWRMEIINQKHLKIFRAFSLNVAQDASDLSKV